MPGSPYSDLDRPPLSARALDRALAGGMWRLDLRTETGSTNADVMESARAGAPEGLVVIAEQQLAGRGRRDRQWTSPARAGLTLSVLLRPDVATKKHWGWLPLMAGVALREAVERVAEVDATLKWPNDLLVGDRKCAGILAEALDDGVVVGMGLNVSTREDELPAGVEATSLRLAGAAGADREPLLKALLRGLGRWYDGWREAGGDAELCGLLAAYRRSCATIGRPARVQLPGGGELIGDAVDVDNDGLLVIRSADGSDHRVSAGDVVHVR